MNQASFYSKYNALQKADANFVIDKVFSLIKRKDSANILDVGCGDGSVTLELLLPKFKKNFNKLIGIDISEEMVRFAKSKWQNYSSKIDFARMDIASTIFPVEFHEYFDFIFSFYCLHWVTDQRQAIRNLFNMLKPGGNMLVAFLASHPIFDVYEKMANTSRWSPYLADTKKVISPYHHSDNPQSQLENILEKEGFTVHLCSVEDRSYSFPDISLFIKTHTAVNPFIQKIPKNDVDSYVKDYMNEVRKIENFKIDDDGKGESILVSYKLFVVFASKPL